jgi:class 3 adenylate cyclase
VNAKAVLECRNCGASVEPRFRFCPDCGQRLGGDEAKISASAPASKWQAPPEGLAQKVRAAQGIVIGERKQVTVLFCDLAGSTAIAEGIDPEAYRELLDSYLELTFAEIYRYDGIVNQLAGDGVMALFGAPVAHEDAPARAVSAALGILGELERLNERLREERDLELKARIGTHTGLVVVGTVGNDLKMDYTAVGDTTNLAARLESLAESGTCLISEATSKLVRGRFRLASVGPLEVKGKRERVTAFRVLGPTDGATRMEIAASRGLTPFVGRDRELARLEASVRHLGARRAQMVAIVGEAGIGKSRLVYEFTRRIAHDAALVLQGECASLKEAIRISPSPPCSQRAGSVSVRSGACSRLVAWWGSRASRGARCSMPSRRRSSRKASGFRSSSYSRTCSGSTSRRASSSGWFSGWRTRAS